MMNGLDGGVKSATHAMNELTFEEDEDDQFYLKDLPKHACALVAPFLKPIIPQRFSDA